MSSDCRSCLREGEREERDRERERETFEREEEERESGGERELKNQTKNLPKV